MKNYYLILPILGIYFIYASYKGYRSPIGNYFRFKKDKTNKVVDKTYNASIAGTLFLIFTVLVFQ